MTIMRCLFLMFVAGRIPCISHVRADSRLSEAVVRKWTDDIVQCLGDYCGGVPKMFRSQGRPSEQSHFQNKIGCAGANNNAFPVRGRPAVFERTCLDRLLVWIMCANAECQAELTTGTRVASF